MIQFPFEDDFSVSLRVVPYIYIVVLIDMPPEGEVRHTTAHTQLIKESTLMRLFIQMVVLTEKEPKN